MTFAMVECNDGEWRPAMGGKRWIDDSLVWVFSSGKYRDRDTSTSRPLVVIDPEDREAVERLMRLGFPNALFPAAADDLQDALREYANPTPPKPEEPTGLGDVVEDADGTEWVLVFNRSNRLWRASGPGDEVPWSKIDAVRVVSRSVPVE